MNITTQSDLIQRARQVTTDFLSEKLDSQHAAPIRFCSEGLAQGNQLEPLKRLPARRMRAILGLLKGPLMREQLNGLVGCSNSPQIVITLRRKGIDIYCEKVDRTDRDGEPCRPGRYSLTKEDRLKALQYLVIA